MHTHTHIHIVTYVVSLIVSVISLSRSTYRHTRARAHTHMPQPHTSRVHTTPSDLGVMELTSIEDLGNPRVLPMPGGSRLPSHSLSGSDSFSSDKWFSYLITLHRHR